MSFQSLSTNSHVDGAQVKLHCSLRSKTALQHAPKKTPKKLLKLGTKLVWLISQKGLIEMTEMTWKDQNLQFNDPTNKQCVCIKA